MREIIIADNQNITALGIKHLAQSIKDVEYVFEATTKIELIKHLSSYPEALIILDYTLFDFQCFQDLLITTLRFPQTQWIMFSDELNIELITQLVFNHHTFSIVLKSSGIDEINTALSHANKRERFICNHISNQLLNLNRPNRDSTDNLLTNNEKEILKEIALGKTTKEIAADRNLSIHTIITHRKNIFRKIDVNNVHEATKYAMKAGIIDFAEYCI